MVKLNQDIASIPRGSMLESVYQHLVRGMEASAFAPARDYTGSEYQMRGDGGTVVPDTEKISRVMREDSHVSLKNMAYLFASSIQMGQRDAVGFLPLAGGSMSGRLNALYGFSAGLDGEQVIRVSEDRGSMSAYREALMVDGNLHVSGDVCMKGYTVISCSDGKYVINANDIRINGDSIIPALNGGGGGGGSVSIQELGRHFLRKDAPDRTKFFLTMEAGAEFGRFTGNTGARIDKHGAITSNGIQSHSFTSGMLGSGFCVKKDSVTGRSYVETDTLLVRRNAIFAVLEILKTRYVAGDIIQGPAGGTCAEVREFDTYYRCYLTVDDGQKKVENTFEVDDLVRCQEFNVREGVYENVRNQYYWRRCVAKGDDYIDLSKTDCDEGSMPPLPGDDMATMGNRTVLERQHANVYGVYGDGAPYIKQYVGISSYDLTGREKTVLSPHGNKLTGKLFFESGGDAESAFNELQEAMRENVNFVQQIGQELEAVKNQQDGNISTWFLDPVPTLENEPYISWKDDKERDNHLKDLYFDARGQVYRFEKQKGQYGWILIEDEQLAKALADAKKAQDTADGKRRVFVRQPSFAEAYDEGDLWVNAVYHDDTYSYSGDLLRCQVAKLANTPFLITHWVKATNYTGDESLQNFIDNVYNVAIGDIMKQLDGVVETWFGDGLPTVDSGWTTVQQKESHLGDLYYDNLTGIGYRYSKDQEQYVWIEIRDSGVADALKAAQQAQDTADGKRRVFVSQPYTPYDEGDLWASGVFLKRCVHSRQEGSYVPADWEDATSYTGDENLNKFVDEVFNFKISDIYGQLDRKTETWFTGTDPSLNWKTEEEKRLHIGDMWYNSYAKTLHRYSSTYSWDKIEDAGAIKAAEDASRAQDTADGKRRVFVSQPADSDAYDEGDLWANANYHDGIYNFTDDLLRCKTSKEPGQPFSITHWVRATGYTGDENLNSFIENVYNVTISDIMKQLDGVVETWFGHGKPTLSNHPAKDWPSVSQREAHLGDIYYDNDTSYGYRFSKDEDVYAWKEIKDSGVADALKAAQQAQDTADGKRRVFVTTPYVPYDEGDLWASGVFLKRCIHSRSVGAYDSRDWDDATKYTGDENLNNFIDNVFETRMSEIINQVDRKTETWFTSADPSFGWTSVEEKKSHVGDLWYDSYTKSLKRYSGAYAWESIEDKTAIDAADAASHAQDTADGKRRVFVSTPATEDEYDEGDLWANATYGPYSNELLRCTRHKDAGVPFDIAHWTKACRYTGDENLNDFINNTFKNSMGDLKSQVDGKINMYYQSYNPWFYWDAESYPEHVGDLWYNTQDKTLSRYAGGQNVWQPVEDKAAIAAAEAASRAQDTADRKRRVFVEQPADSDAYDVGDLWVNASYSDGIISYTNDLLRCEVSKEAGSPFDISHWGRATNYTDDSGVQDLEGRAHAKFTAMEDKIEAEVKRIDRHGADLEAHETRILQTENDITAQATRVTTIGSKVESHTTLIQQNADNIALKASQTEVDGMGEAIRNNSTAIQQNAESIALKASSEALGRLEQTVTSQGTAIKTNASSISLMASKDTVSKLQGTVDHHTTLIQQNAGAIGLRAEYTYVDRIKGETDDRIAAIELDTNGIRTKVEKTETTVSGVVQTVSTHSTEISQMHNEISLKVREGVESVSVGGRNMLLGTNMGKEGWNINTNNGKGVISAVTERNTSCVKIHFDKIGTSWNLMCFKCGDSYKMWRNSREYTLSFDILPSVDFRSSVHLSTHSSTETLATFGGFTATGGVWNHIELHAVFADDAEYVNEKKWIMMACGYTGDFIIQNMMLEEGNKASSWKPALEDTEKAADQKLLDTGIDVKNKKIVLTAGQTWVQDNTGSPIALFQSTDDGGIRFESNVYCTYVQAVRGSIGAFTITERGLTNRYEQTESNNNKMAQLHIEKNGVKFFSVNMDSYMCHIRNDEGTALRLTTYRDTGTCLSCTSNGRGKAIESNGNMDLFARDGEAVTIHGLCLNCKNISSNYQIRSDDDILVFTNQGHNITVQLPYPVHIGKKLIIKTRTGNGVTFQNGRIIPDTAVDAVPNRMYSGHAQCFTLINIGKDEWAEAF